MSRSIRAIYQSPYSRYKAAQLTQESNFAISVVEDLKIYWNNGQDYTNALYDIGAAVTRTGVHLQLSNSFEQWRINSVTIKFQLKTFAGDVINLYEDVDIKQYIDFYTAVRRNKKTDNSIEELDSNSSYEQVTWPADGLGACVPLKRTIHNSSLRMASTKMTAPFPYIAYGLRLHGNDHFMENKIFQTPFVISMQLQAKCSYKGLRLDKSNVLTSINPNVVNYTNTPTWYIPTISKMILTKGLFGIDPNENTDLLKQPWIFTSVSKTETINPGRSIVVIKPDSLLPNFYGINGYKKSMTAQTSTVTVPADSYYTLVPNIFEDISPSVYLYLYDTNGKLVVSIYLNRNSLPNVNDVRLHADMQKLKERIISE